MSSSVEGVLCEHGTKGQLNLREFIFEQEYKLFAGLPRKYFSQVIMIDIRFNKPYDKYANLIKCK